MKIIFRMLRLMVGILILSFSTSCMTTNNVIAKGQNSLEYIGNFNEGLAPAKKNGKFGYINMDGEEVIPFIYDDASVFRYGIALVGKNSSLLSGYKNYVSINKNNDILTVGRPYNIDVDDEGNYFIVNDGDYGITQVNENGEPIRTYCSNIYFEYIINIVTIDNKKYFYTEYWTEDGDDSWGIFNETGELLFPEYFPLSNFDEGLANVAFLKNPDDEESTYGFININGDLVFTIDKSKYDYMFSFEDGFCRVVKNDNDLRKYGFIDKKGELIIPVIYNSVEVFNNGLCCVQLDDKWGVINDKNEVIIPIKYEEIIMPFDSEKDSLIAVKKRGVWGFIDKNGNEILPFEWKDTSGFSNGLAGVKVKNNWRIINDKGEYISDL